MEGVLAQRSNKTLCWCFLYSVKLPVGHRIPGCKLKPDLTTIHNLLRMGDYMCLKSTGVDGYAQIIYTWLCVCVDECIWHVHVNASQFRWSLLYRASPPPPQYIFSLSWWLLHFVGPDVWDQTDEEKIKQLETILAYRIILSISRSLVIYFTGLGLNAYSGIQNEYSFTWREWLFKSVLLHFLLLL